MAKWITEVNFQFFENAKQIIFSNGLNIVSGTNGTGKTKLLQFIQQNNGNGNICLSDETNSTTLSAFSPQRNASKLVGQQAMQFFRQDLNATENALNIFRAQILDDGFQTLKSISEYFVYLAEETIRAQDIKPSESITHVKSIFEGALKRVFDFNIKFDLNRDAKSYDLGFEKNGILLTPQQLSHGENAIIVLICALIFGKNSADTFLIDEPEIHLNWSLEEKLFEFFDWFCSEFERQIIVVTHSRVAFLEKYEGKRQFFERKGSEIFVSTKPSEELTRLLAGDTVQLLQGITTKKMLVYVEDTSHKTILDEICEKLSLDVEILKSGDCEKVKSLSQALKDRNVDNVYFLIDGDNKPLNAGDKSKLHTNTIQLEKYCIENYFFNLDILNLRPLHDLKPQNG